MNFMCLAELCFIFMCQYQLFRAISYQYYQVHRTVWNILYLSCRKIANQLFVDLTFPCVRAVFSRFIIEFCLLKLSASDACNFFLS